MNKNDIIQSTAINDKVRDQSNAIQNLLDSGMEFAVFRRPHAENVELILQTEGEARTVSSEETELRGFIFAPFHECKSRPTLLIRPDIRVSGWDSIAEVARKLPEQEYIKLNQLDHEGSEFYPVRDSLFYKDRFSDTLTQIERARFEKLVLTYCEESIYYAINGQEASVFIKALEKYPNAMVYLTYTRKAGRWIGATPELLLERNNNAWHTIALAGTHTQRDGEWDEKNIHEQDVVRRYIKERLESLHADCSNETRSIMHIGPLMHIRTDFDFSFASPISTMEVVRCLHPTPAICGYPQEEAYQYLLKYEQGCRNYFTGYLGVIDGDQTASLYVNLRCAQIEEKTTYYHAGGGITELSLIWEEVDEIERKMQMLKSLC